MSETVNLIPCKGCGAMVADTPGPSHAYIGASPGCWAIFGEVTAGELSERGRFSVHKLTVDTYAVQHPGTPSRQAIQSVASHLVSLYLTLERGLNPDAAMLGMKRALRHKDKFIWLEPPDFKNTMTVLDVRGALNPAEHIERVKSWAQSVWQAWSPHHASVKYWAELQG